MPVSKCGPPLAGLNPALTCFSGRPYTPILNMEPTGCSSQLGFFNPLYIDKEVLDLDGLILILYAVPVN